MTNHDDPGAPAQRMPDTPSTNVTDAATSGAADVVASASTGAKETANEVAAQAKVIAGEAQHQVVTLVDRTRHELGQQADERTRQAAGGLRTLADQVSALADGRPDDAPSLAGYMRDAQNRLSQFAERLDARGPQGLVDDVANFARRRPAVFLVAATGAGFVVGRLARAGRGALQRDDAASSSPVPQFQPAQPLVAAPLVDPPVGAPV